MVLPPLRSRTLICAALACIAGCRPEAREPPPFTERDSAGVRIVISVGDDGAVPRWRLAAAPALDLGGAPAGTNRFHRIRGVIRLASGRIAVVDGASGEIRWFDAAGSHVASMPFPGHTDDPGSLWLLGVQGSDTVVVWDGRDSRVARFDDNGALVDTATIALGLPRFQPWAVFDDGPLLATWRPDPPAPAPGQVVFDSTRMLVVDREGRSSTHIVTTPGVWWWSGPAGPEAVPFTGNAVFAIAANHIVVASGPQWAIERRDRSGAVLERYARNRPPPHVTRADVAAHRARVARTLSDPREAAARLTALEGMPWPPARPTWDRLLVDDAGAIWVRNENPDPDADRHWTVFGPNGGVIARLRTPVFLEIWQVAGDLVLGTGHDARGNEHVWGYRLDRS
jgi:hypothetical protein